MIPLAAVIADLCASTPQPAETRDVDDAAAYARAGDDARASGDLRIAALAYKKAIALDPASPARKSLADLCRAETTKDSEAALLAAIALLRAGDVDAAQSALLPIAASGDAGAHFFLGLIALRRHHGADAARELELAMRDSSYAELAEPLLRLARREGRISVAALVAPELDNNPQLLPGTPPAGALQAAPRADESLLLAATLTARPIRWLVLRNVLAWRKQRTLSALDFLSESAQAGVELERRMDHLAIRYDLEDDVLDGVRYMLASRLTAGYRRDVKSVELGASYSLRYRTLERASERAFTGWVHAADVGAIVHATQQISLELRAIGSRELTSDPTFSHVTIGGRGAARVAARSRLRATAGVAAWYARYDERQPDGLMRRDIHLESTAELEVDLGDHVIAIGGASVTRNDSTIEDFRYWKIVVRAGLSFVFGGL